MSEQIKQIFICLSFLLGFVHINNSNYFQNVHVQGIIQLLGKSYKELSICQSQERYWGERGEQDPATFLKYMQTRREADMATITPRQSRIYNLRNQIMWVQIWAEYLWKNLLTALHLFSLFFSKIRMMETILKRTVGNIK